MKRGEIYRVRERIPERGGKPGFYLIVSRSFIVGNEDVSTVICAPIYGNVLGLSTEVPLGPSDGLPHDCAARCDFLTLMFKARLTDFVASLPPTRTAALDRALTLALALPSQAGGTR